MVKFGFRTPSLKKSLSARTLGKGTRSLKKLINPAYGKKGVGIFTNPKKAVYNKVYNKTTFGISDLFKGSTEKQKVNTEKERASSEYQSKFTYLQNQMHKFQHEVDMCNQSQELAKTTKNIDTFLTNMDAAIKSLKRAIQIYEKDKDEYRLNGGDLNQSLIDLEAERPELEQAFAIRYFKENKEKAEKLKTERGKINNLSRGKQKFLDRQADFLPETLDFIKKLYDEVNEKSQQP